jgi:hypothetical protein
VLYQPQQHLPFTAALGSLPQAPPAAAFVSQQQRDLDTGHNDNAALKSVWRSLTPAQRKSLAGMWDIIKTEQLLPRLMPSSSLAPLPGCSTQQQQQQQQQHTVIEEVDDDAEPAKQQQLQPVGGAVNGFPADGLAVRNGFTQPSAVAPAEAPAGDDVMMQVDHQQQQQQQVLIYQPPPPPPQQQQQQELPDGASRQPSVTDMEM